MPSLLITDLRVSPGAEEELAAHRLSPDDAVEVWLEDPSFFRDKVEGRIMMIGPNGGGRLLSIVIAPTHMAGEWDVVTGWRSGKSDRTAWQNLRRTRRHG